MLSYRSIQQGLLSIGFISLPVYAISPVPGSYAGVFLGPTFTQNINFTLNQFVPLPPDSLIPSGTTGKLTYSVLGGVGGEIGYRFCTKLRAEIEVFYNNNPFSELTIGNRTINSVSSSAQFHIQGDTNTGAALFNFFYDALTPSQDYYGAVFPYIGVGVGYAYVQNSLQFHYNTPAYLITNPQPAMTNFETDFTRAFSTIAGQAIVGVGYFLDDFTWLSADIRYFATNKVETTSANGTSTFTQQAKLLSIMVSFNGALNGL